MRLAQAHYAHLAAPRRRVPPLPLAVARAQDWRWCASRTSRRFVAALAQGKGVLVLTGHFGNWEVATIAGIGNFPEMRGRFHFVRRAIKPHWLDALVTRRFKRAGFGVLRQARLARRDARPRWSAAT